jgi:hypothetical protein
MVESIILGKREEGVRMEKTELLEALEDGQQELVDLLSDLPDEALLEPGVVGDWSIKDILAHLTQWEGQVVTLLFQAQRGVDKPTTAHFGKESVDELNQRWQAAGKERPLERVWDDWLGVRKQTIRRVGEFSEQDLNDPRHFAWLDGFPLWHWIANDSIEHESEHADQIREWLDQRDTASGSNGRR